MDDLVTPHYQRANFVRERPKALLDIGQVGAASNQQSLDVAKIVEGAVLEKIFDRDRYDLIDCLSSISCQLLQAELRFFAA